MIFVTKQVSGKIGQVVQDKRDNMCVRSHLFMTLENKRDHLFHRILFMSLEDKRTNLFRRLLFMSYDVSLR